MYVSEIEYERDPTLMTTRLYDKINPYIDGFEEHNPRRGWLSAEALKRLREEDEADALASQSR